MKTLASWERRVVAERSREAASNVDKAVDLYTCFRLDGFPTSSARLSIRLSIRDASLRDTHTALHIDTLHILPPASFELT